MSQTTPYAFTSAVAQPGMIFDIRPHTVQSFAAEIAMDPGKPVRRGTLPAKQVLIGDATNFLGVAIFTHTLEQAYPAGGATYAIGDAVSVLTRGAIWVQTSVGSIVAGNNAYVTSGGLWTNVVGSNLLVGKFITNGAINEIVAVEIG